MLSFFRRKIFVRTKIHPVFKNKYFLSALLFLIWLSFIDSDSFWVQYSLHQQHKELSLRKQRLEKDLISIKQEIDAYHTHPQLLEKYAREQYLMKKDNETLFLLIEK